MTNKKQQIDDLVEELKLYLQSQGWETHHAEVVVDGIIEVFGSDLLPDGLTTYDELAKNQGVGTPPPLDKKAVALLDEIKQLVLEK